MLELTTLCAIAGAAGAEVGEQLVFPARGASTAPAPEDLHPAVAQRLRSLYPHGLYTHQVAAIREALRGSSVCLATPTASGKTLIFTTVCLTGLLQDAGSVVLALYPAKALLHDQREKWLEACAGTGIDVGIIDGGVEVPLRPEVLRKSRIVLMTPDVAHAWMMAKLAAPEIRKFLGALKIVVLDEAHIYDGVFGTNMAYLLRRLQAVSGASQFVASSATIGDPATFLRLLTGQDFVVIGPDQTGAAVPEKSLLVCRTPVRNISRFVNALIRQYAQGGHGRFLIFVDSRKRVEELAAETCRSLLRSQRVQEPAAAEEDGEIEEAADVVLRITDRRVLPYRAGYEEDDRKAIQQALTRGKLLGVVTTSALELGIDIGDIELVVLLGTPPSLKSFWQRAGRAGRQKQGQVIMLDVDGRVTAIGLQRYLAGEPEPNWLYLDNAYLQYANALCAAEEQGQALPLLYSRAPFRTLPRSFLELLDNEREPTRTIPNELYPLKLQAAAGPHRAFPVRTGIEKSYQAVCRQGVPQFLGTLTYSQLFREAFPGAIYRYMTGPYRIFQVRHASGEIVCTKARGIARTSPLLQTAVFPRFNGQMFYLRKSATAFIAECCLQVSERVIGFLEVCGQNRIEILYGPDDKYARKPLNRYINTTGVTFHVPDESVPWATLGRYLALAFCRVCAVQERDVGWGAFRSQTSPLGPLPVAGFAVYDAAYGSLRLTKQIPGNLPDILIETERIAIEEGAQEVAVGVARLRAVIATLGAAQENVLPADVFPTGAPDQEWLTVVAPQQLAVCHDGQSRINEEVTVLHYLYTPQGMRYTLKAAREDIQWQVSAAIIQPIHGVTKLEQYNINTGETRDCG